MLLKKAGLFFILFNLLFTGISYPQVFPYHNYTTKDGLCNSNVYYMLQDKTGYMWFATNNGLSRFDGHTFQNFYTPNGLNSNNFTGIAEGEDSVLYFSTYDRGINFLRNNKFENYKINYKETFLIHQFQSYKDTLYFYGSSSLGFINKNNLQFQQKPLTYLAYSLYIDPQGIRYLGTEIGLLKLNALEREVVTVEGMKNESIYKITGDKYGNLWLGCKGKIFKVRDNKVIETIILDNNISENIFKLYIDRRDNIWFHPVNKGLFIYKNGEVFDIGKKFNLGKTPVTHITEDREGNVWVSTTGKGVYCFNNLFIENFFESDGLSNNNITSILSGETGNTTVGTFDGLNVFNGKRFYNVDNLKTPNITNYIFEIKKGMSDNFIVLCTFLGSFVMEKTENNINFTFLKGISGLEYDNKSFVIGSTANVLNFYSRDGISVKPDSLFVFGEIMKFVKINEIEKDKSGNLWVGTNRGLCKINKFKQKFFYDNPVLYSSVSCIRIDSRERIWVAGDRGIAILIPPGDSIISFEKNNDFDISSSNSMDFDNSGNVWIGNNKGLYRISEKKFFENNIDSALFFNETNGLPSSEVHSISFDKKNNELWIGTVSGLARFNLTDLNKYVSPPPKIQINSIELPDTSITFRNNIEFEPSQNNIRLKLASLYYGSPSSINFEYKFENDNQWIDIISPVLEFASLSPGSYNLRLRVENLHNLKSEITSFNFKIRAPFWRTIYFNIGVIICIMVLFTFISYKRVKYIQKKSKEKLETEISISSLKHQALSASMNPHFIFNALNSIQYYISQHKKEEANEYLVNFSRLIRMNLEYADKTFISLESELIRLELYLQYEKLRFENRINYSINISKEIEPGKLEIPNMLLQPFVENAIWHGLLHKKGKGEININISRKEKTVSGKYYTVIDIEIIDDGIGLEDSKKYKKSNHVSKGISIITERLNLLESEIKNFKFITIKERTDGIQGVVVNITLLPKQYNTID